MTCVRTSTQYPDHPELRAKVLELFKEPLFQPRYDMVRYFNR